MKDQKRKLAEVLLDYHPGIPDMDVSTELVESMYYALRKFLVQYGVLHLEGIGTLKIKNIKGTPRRKDGRTGFIYKISDRKVLKVDISMNFKKYLNRDRQPNERLE